MPSIRPVNHLVDAGEIVIRASLPDTHTPYTAGISVPDGTVVAYEADNFDPSRRSGWSW
jgi:hypothetical protein